MKLKTRRLLILGCGAFLIMLAFYPRLATTNTVERDIASGGNPDMNQTVNQQASKSTDGIASQTKDKVQSFTFSPIGIVHSPYSKDKRPPRQGRLAPDVPAKIEIYREFEEGLEGLEDCEYIIVLFVFDQSQGWHPKVTPHGASHSRGVFSTRSPNRPCPIGMTLVKLDKVEDCTLYISGIDAFDKTPILDIKPYVKSIDSLAGDTEEVEKKLGLK